MAIIEGLSLNISLSSAKAFGFTFGPERLIPIITTMVKKKAQPILIRKGISYPPFPLG